MIVIIDATFRQCKLLGLVVEPALPPPTLQSPHEGVSVACPGGPFPHRGVDSFDSHLDHLTVGFYVSLIIILLLLLLLLLSFLALSFATMLAMINGGL